MNDFGVVTRLPISGMSGSDAYSFSRYGMSADSKKMLDLAEKYNQKERAWSAEQAQKQMDFQEKMSSTAHQREVADLQAAGLNPVLSAGGSGAASATGAMGESSGIGDIIPGLLNSLNQQNELNFQKSKLDYERELQLKKYDLDLEKFKFEQQKWSDQMDATAAKLLSKLGSGSGFGYGSGYSKMNLPRWTRKNILSNSLLTYLSGAYGMSVDEVIAKTGSEGLGWLLQETRNAFPVLESLFRGAEDSYSAAKEQNISYDEQLKREIARFGERLWHDTKRFISEKTNGHISIDSFDPWFNASGAGRK